MSFHQKCWVEDALCVLQEKGYVTADVAKEQDLHQLKLSGTKFRQLLRSGADIPDWFAFKSVVDVLREATPCYVRLGHKANFVHLFLKFPGFAAIVITYQASLAPRHSISTSNFYILPILWTCTGVLVENLCKYFVFSVGQD